MMILFSIGHNKNLFQSRLAFCDFKAQIQESIHFSGRGTEQERNEMNLMREYARKCEMDTLKRKTEGKRSIHGMDLLCYLDNAHSPIERVFYRNERERKRKREACAS